MSHKPERLGTSPRAILKPYAFSLSDDHYRYLQSQKRARLVSYSQVVREALEAAMKADGFAWEGRDHEQA